MNQETSKGSMLTLIIALLLITTSLFVGSGYYLFLRPWQPGDAVAADLFAKAQSLSAQQALELDLEKNMFFSNTPELPTEEGILTRVDNVVSKNGETRVFFSHFNLLIDYNMTPYKNIPARIGIVLVNETQRTVDIYSKRMAKGVSRTVRGEQIYKDDLAPLEPGKEEPVYYGTQLGNAVFASFLTSNPGGKETLFASLEPGEKAWFYEEAGTKSWAIGMADLVFRDHGTGQPLTLDSLAPGERIGARSFIANLSWDLDQFYGYTDRPGAVLNRSTNEHLHMRGLFQGGVYANSPKGEGISRRFAVTYNGHRDGLKSLTFNVGQRYQNHDPKQPFYEPTMFINDILRNGWDEYGIIKGGVATGRISENNGSYGVDYEVTLTISGGAVLAIQGYTPAPGQYRDENPPVDMYNQFLTLMVDGQVQTVRLVDPNFSEYYRDFDRLEPLGTGRVVHVFPDEGTQTHTLRIGMAPNSYGPYKVLLMPLTK